jgi:hypothetical protein
MAPDERLIRKLHDKKPLTDDDHVAIQRAWFAANPDPAFLASVREQARSPFFRVALRVTLNEMRQRYNLPPVTNAEFERLLHVMQRVAE